MNARTMFPGHNPFSTRYVRPGAIPYLFAPGESLARLVARFESQGHCGQIVGPHGSGKSTLLATLVDALRDAGHEVLAFTQREGQRQLAGPLPRNSKENGSLIVVIDGFEQLSAWRIWRLRHQCRLHGWGLLVTTHRPSGLPLLYETQPSLAMVERLRQTLLPPSDNRVTSNDVEDLFERHQGNVREALFGLYDRYEARRRQA